MNAAREYESEQYWVNTRKYDRRLQLTPAEFTEEDEVIKILTAAMTAVGVFSFILLFLIVMTILIHWVNAWAAVSVASMTLTIWFFGKYKGWW